MPLDRDTAFEEFERRGELHVRDRLSGFSEEWRALAIEWLTLQDQGRERTESARKSLEISAALRSAAAAEQAIRIAKGSNIIAVIALAAAIVSIIISVILHSSR